MGKRAQELKPTFFLMYRSLVLDMVLTRLKVHLQKARSCVHNICLLVILCF
eukprot:UN05596